MMKTGPGYNTMA